MNFLFLAQANAPQAPTGSLIGMLPMFAMILLIFYFIVYRPQKKEQKKREELINSLKKGDKIVTAGGIHGVVAGIKETTVIVKVDDEVKLEVNKSSVSLLEK